MRNRFESFAGCILELNRCLQKIKEAEMNQFGLRAGHTMCMYYLGSHEEGLTATQLIELCREDKGAMSRTLAQLSELDMVFNDRTDGKRSYRTRYFLTEKGREVTEKMTERIECALRSGGNGLTDETRAVFYEAMDIILANLSAYQNKED